MKQHLKLSELGELLGTLVASVPFRNCWVMAEILQSNQAASGHIYMELVEKEGRQVVAKLQAVLWQRQMMMLRMKLGADLFHLVKAGSKVLLNVDLDFHPVYGLKLVVQDIDPSASLGEMELKRLETLRKLEEGNYFDLNKDSHRLPLVLQRIAVISSATAAGYTDFTNHIGQNEYGYSVGHRLYAASMQGATAAKDIMRALKQIEVSEVDYDVVLIMRGGGSKFDLECFNDYDLAVAIAEYPMPVITAIGHQRDVSVADMVSFEPVKTPTAAAEMILNSFLHYEQSLLTLHQQVKEKAIGMIKEDKEWLVDLQNRFQLATRGILQGNKERLVALNERMVRGSQQQLLLEKQKINELTTRYRMSSSTLLDKKGALLQNWQERLGRAAQQRIKSDRKELEVMEKMVSLLGLEKTLKRGFSVTRKDGKTVMSVEELKEGDRIETELLGGTVGSIVDGP